MTSPSSRAALATLLATALVAGGCAESGGGEPAKGTGGDRGEAIYTITDSDSAGYAKAVFAGGCFWCVETAFEGVPGVNAVISGFAGGDEASPTYEEVASGRTAHAEAVLVTYEPQTIGYEELLEIFWVNHDPTTGDRQFCDRGRQYRPGIFYLDEDQRRAAEASVDWARAHMRVDAPIVTEITEAGRFWPAETYHQDFWRKSPGRYQSYRIGCGRDARLEEIWGELAPGGH